MIVAISSKVSVYTFTVETLDTRNRKRTTSLRLTTLYMLFWANTYTDMYEFKRVPPSQLLLGYVKQCVRCSFMIFFYHHITIN